MLRKTFEKLLNKPNFLAYIYKRYSKEIEACLDVLDNYRVVTETTRKFTYGIGEDNPYGDSPYSYKRMRKFSEIAKELESDPRKYKTYHSESYSSSIKGFTRILECHKLHQVDDNWDIYIPNGYNRIEIELEKLKTSRPDQIIFGIPGCDELVGKSCLWRALEAEFGREKAATILPETFILAEEDQIKLFKDHYKEGETYILKQKKQRKQGLLLTQDLNEILSAKEKEYVIVQDYKKNVLLVNNRKLNLRIYLLLTIKNNILEAHINKYGTCIYNNKDYDPTTNDFESNITSYNLDLKIYDTNPLTFKQLKTYLSEHGYENPNILFERIDEKMKMVCDAIKPKLGRLENLKDNMCVQIFGMDFIVDTDLNPYLLECNKGPDMSPKKDGTYASLINKIEDFYSAEKLVEKCYPDGYKSGNGLKVQRDMFKYLDIIDLKSSNNGFYKIY